MENSIDCFFLKTFEDEVNRRLLHKDFILSVDKVIGYIKHINSTEIKTYLLWLDEHFSLVTLGIEDAVQYSNFDVATYSVVEKMIMAGDIGYSHLEIGKMLQEDGKKRTNVAYIKYGENHVKTARYLGYVFSLRNFYYVSALGYVLDRLDDIDRKKLYARLFVRTNLFKTIYYLSKSGEVPLRRVFDMLSDTTYIRRRSNIKMLFEKLVEEEPDCEEIIRKIIY